MSRAEILPFPARDRDPTRAYRLEGGAIRPVPAASRAAPVRLAEWCAAAPPPRLVPTIRVVEVEVPPHWSAYLGMFCAGILFSFIMGIVH